MQSIENGREIVEGSDLALTNMQKETEEMLQTLKDKSDHSMEEILKAVINFSEMMENIEVASTEHASGISEVNEAIAEMDKMTQENSVMVEQNASASQNMAVEAENLRQMFSSKQSAHGESSSRMTAGQLDSGPAGEQDPTRTVSTLTSHKEELEQEVPQIGMPEWEKRHDNLK